MGIRIAHFEFGHVIFKMAPVEHFLRFFDAVCAKRILETLNYKIMSSVIILVEFCMHD